MEISYGVWELIQRDSEACWAFARTWSYIGTTYNDDNELVVWFN